MEQYQPKQPDGKKHDRRVEEALERIEAGISAIHDSSSFKEYLRFVSHMHEYSYNNIMLIMSQFPSATRVAGYRKWQELGRQVQKDEKGIAILYPMVRIVTAPATQQLDDLIGQPRKADSFLTIEPVPAVQRLDDRTGEPRKPEKIITGFGVGYVFDVSQTEGEPLPEPPATKAILDRPDEAKRALALGGYLIEFLKEEGVSVAVERMPIPGMHRYYDHTRQHIGLGDHLGDIHSCKTLAHEAAHHVDADRPHASKPDREIVGEGGAYVVLYRHQIDTSDYSFAYVARWAKQPDVLKANLDQIQRVSNTLFVGIDRAAERVQARVSAMSQEERERLWQEYA